MTTSDFANPGGRHVLLADLAALPGCIAITDTGHVRDGLWSCGVPELGHQL